MLKKTPTRAKTKSKSDVPGKDKYILQLYVTGISPNSANAIVNSKKILEKYLQARYDLEVIDIYQQPDLAIKENIIAVPVMIKKFPLPEARIIGDLSDTESVLTTLRLI